LYQFILTTHGDVPHKDRKEHLDGKRFAADAYVKQAVT